MNSSPRPPESGTPSPSSLSSTELGERLILGELTAAQYLGFSQQRLYEIATIGHTLLNEGKLPAALDIFKGLVAASPYDSVFHCNLAAAYVQLQRLPEAMSEYTQALELNVANVDALVGRSELLLRAGKVGEALHDIQLALEFDPNLQRETTQRARANLLLLQAMADTVEAPPSARP